MPNLKLIENHWYKFLTHDGCTHIGQYTGQDQGFECCVCRKGCKAHTFNIWYDKDGGYETWGFGNKHLPKIIEDIGEQNEVIIDK